MTQGDTPWGGCAQAGGAVALFGGRLETETVGHVVTFFDVAL
jgi:hypothetical protein